MTPDTVHVGLLYGGLSSEHEVSINSARNVLAALDTARYTVTPIRIDRQGRWHAETAERTVLNGTAGEGDGRRVLFAPAERGAELRLDGAEPLGLDVVVPMIHGQNGEDGRMQGFLTILGLPYVGPDVLGSAVCMDKEVAKRLLRDAGLPVVPFRILRPGQAADYDEIAAELGATLFVKPANAGSSVGVSKVESAEALDEALENAFHYDRKVLVEAAITGREIECAVLGNEEPLASVPGEIVVTATFYTYEAKYLDADASRMDVPADLPAEVAERVRALAAQAFTILGCEGMARVDFFVTPDGTLYINEINTIPGFTERSMYPVMMQHTGLAFGPLVDRLIQLALDRHARDARLLTTR